MPGAVTSCDVKSNRCLPIKAPITTTHDINAVRVCKLCNSTTSYGDWKWDQSNSLARTKTALLPPSWFTFSLDRISKLCPQSMQYDTTNASNQARDWCVETLKGLSDWQLDLAAQRTFTRLETIQNAQPSAEKALLQLRSPSASSRVPHRQKTQRMIESRKLQVLFLPRQSYGFLSVTTGLSVTDGERPPVFRPDYRDEKPGTP